ncbi:IMP dehydrogenase [Polyangium aurulentum]|uniref:IMP dehydrogenase n=1 Tax=Polyangium aurulentum TaxID=2567896 RepID=UPI0010ADF3DD|nr:IMP dehydrogenase [Polyangium aurulentum]UQA54970.1 IMP dehydrogenase [Polyangium aurulentum]
MARERNRNGLAGSMEMRGTPSTTEDVVGARAAPPGRTSVIVEPEEAIVPSKAARRYCAVEPGAEQRTASVREAILPLLCFTAVAVVVAVLSKSLVVRAAVPIALGVVLVALLVRAAAKRGGGKLGVDKRGVSLDGHRLFFHAAAGRPRLLFSMREPFGMTLVASPRRDRMVAVWSSPEGLFQVGASFQGAPRRALGALFDRAFTMSGDEAALEAIGPDGVALELSASDFSSLVFAVEDVDPACVERLVLSDARGAPLTLDGRELVVGERRFDLTAPLEWRPFVFQEAFGSAVAVYQGTWVRQGANETVLVALLPSILPFEPDEEGDLDRCLLRDMRLMAASPEAPPSREVRVAIDRLFVLPVRAALDKAPRASQQPTRARA